MGDVVLGLLKRKGLHSEWDCIYGIQLEFGVLAESELECFPVEAAGETIFFVEESPCKRIAQAK